MTYIIKMIIAYLCCCLFYYSVFCLVSVPSFYKINWLDIYLLLPLIYAAIALSLKQITQRNNNTNE